MLELVKWLRAYQSLLIARDKMRQATGDPEWDGLDAHIKEARIMVKSLDHTWTP